MKLKLLKNLLSNKDKKLYSIDLMNLLNFIMEIGATSSLAIFGSLINKEYNWKFNLKLEDFLNGFDPIVFGILLFYIY